MAVFSFGRGVGFFLLAALVSVVLPACGGDDTPNCVINCVNTEPGHEAAKGYAGDIDCFACEVKMRDLINEVCDLGPGDQCRCHTECG